MLPADRLVLGQAHGEGNLAVLLGSTTGRDGIGGVSVLASAGFGEADEAKRPSVQVGDPFEEKRLIEACLALLDAGLVVGIQDLGGAGLTCATSETASRAGMGMDVDVTAVPRREPGMEPFEVMTCESQERMLAIVTPDVLDEVLRALRALGGAGHRRRPGHRRAARLRILDGFDGEVLADVPASSLHDAAPLYDRPLRRRDRSDEPIPRSRSRRRVAAGATSAPTCSAMLADTALGVAPVRPPALPQHRRGPGRRRHRAAPEAPPHRAATPGGPWPSPPTATTAGAPSTPAPAPPASWPSRC